MGVVLGAICVVGGVKGDNFVAEDVVAWSDALRDGDSPFIAGGDQLVRRPATRPRAPRDESLLVNLIKFEFSLVGGATFAVAVGEVINDRAMMRLWPGGPLKLHSPASSNRDRQRRWRGIIMADDVGAAEIAWVDESGVLVSRGVPAYHRGMARRVGKANFVARVAINDQCVGSMYLIQY